MFDPYHKDMEITLGNPVGSLEVPKLLRARKNLRLDVTDRQRDILIGCILGDAYISPKGKIRIEQSAKQKEYVLWKYNELKSLAYPALPRKIDRVHKLSGREYSSMFFELRQYFRSWRAIFYEERHKVFPVGLSISPIALAVWYMDDGCWTGKKAVIAIEGFDDESIERIQRLFRFGLQIETIVGKNRKLLIRKQSHERFYGLISPYVISSMQYKLPKTRNDLSNSFGEELAE